MEQPKVTPNSCPECGAKPGTPHAPACTRIKSTVNIPLVEIPAIVNSPPHYTKGAVEIIDIIEQIIADYPQTIGWNVGQVIKYLSRAPYKKQSTVDLYKARWYLERAIANAEKESY